MPPEEDTSPIERIETSWDSEPPGASQRAIADDRLELLLSEIHLVAGADALSATARAERIVDIAATIATALA